MAELGSSATGATRDYASLAGRIKDWGLELGFQQVGIADTTLDAYETRLATWLHEGRHGEMAYMDRHGTKRSRPAELVPGTLRVVSARMDYLQSLTRSAHSSPAIRLAETITR